MNKYDSTEAQRIAADLKDRLNPDWTARTAASGELCSTVFEVAENVGFEIARVTQHDGLYYGYILILGRSKVGVSINQDGVVKVCNETRGRQEPAIEMKLVFNPVEGAWESTRPDTSRAPTPGGPVAVRSVVAEIWEAIRSVLTEQLATAAA